MSIPVWPRPRAATNDLPSFSFPRSNPARSASYPAFIDHLFNVTGRHVPLSAEAPPPLLWCDPVALRERFGGRVTELRTTPVIAPLHYRSADQSRPEAAPCRRC